MKVRVTRMGYINHGRVRPDAIIEIDPKQFSKNWMEKLEEPEVEEDEEEFVPAPPVQKKKAKAKPVAKIEKEEPSDETPI